MPAMTGHDAIGVQEVGTYAATGGAVTKTAIAATAITQTKWSDTTPEGWSLRPSVQRAERRSGRTGGVRKSAPTNVDLTFRVSLPDAALDSLRKSLGLPTTAFTGGLVGTPTNEVLEIRPSQIATQTFSLYASAPGPVGPRTLYMPACMVSTMPELSQDRTKYMDNVVEFVVLEPSDSISAWIIDSAT